MSVVRTVIRDAIRIDGHITLDETARHRRRMLMVSDEGIRFLLDLPRARLLRHGDGLVLDDGRVILVQAAPEMLMEVHAEDAAHLVLLAWHIGNRHLSAELHADRIVIRHDPVVRAMLEGLGARIADRHAAFDPAGGAYGDGHAGHHHPHD